MGIRENIERWQKEAIAKGRMEGQMEGRVEGRLEGQMEGRAEGRVEGRQEGEALMLQRLLAKRFGPLPSTIVERTASASQEQIEIWFDRVFDARSIDEVFADSAA